MNTVRSTRNLGRIIGLALTVAAVVGALIATPLSAVAQTSPDDAGASNDTSVTTSARSYTQRSSDGSDDRSGMPGDDLEAPDSQEVEEGVTGERGNAALEPPAAGEIDSGNAPDADDVDDGDSGREVWTPSEDEGVVFDVDQILTFAAAGHTLSEYAELYGISTDELVAALLDEIQAHLTAAVEAGELTQEQAEMLLSSAAEQLGALIGAETGDDDDTGGNFDDDALLSLEVIAGLTGTAVADVEAALALGMTPAEYAAQYGIAEADLISALIADIQLQVANAVAMGELTQAQADEILAGVEERLGALVGDADSADEEPAPGDAGGDPFGSLDTIAELTGTTVDEVMAAVMAGQTLVDFAAEHGVSEDELIAAIAADIEAQIAVDAETGVLTPEQAAQILAYLDEIVTSIVNSPGLGDMIDNLDECAPLPPMDDVMNGVSGGDAVQTPDSICPAG